MKKLLLVLFSFLVITFTGIMPVDASVSSSSQSITKVNDGEIYTYVYVRIDGKLYLYIYLGDLLIEVHEVEE